MLATVFVLLALGASVAGHAGPRQIPLDPALCTDDLDPRPNSLLRLLKRLESGRWHAPMDDSLLETLSRALPRGDLTVHRAVRYAPGAPPEPWPYTHARLRVNSGDIFAKRGITVELLAFKGEPMTFTTSDFVGENVMVLSVGRNLKSDLERDAARFTTLNVGFVEKLGTDRPSFARGLRLELGLTFAESGDPKRLTIWGSEPKRGQPKEREIWSVVLDFDRADALKDLDPADQTYGDARGARVIGP